jgi:hypothetical protein
MKFGAEKRTSMFTRFYEIGIYMPRNVTGCKSDIYKFEIEICVLLLKKLIIKNDVKKKSLAKRYYNL